MQTYLPGTLVFFALVFLGLSGCSKSGEPTTPTPAAPETASASGGGHGAANAVPGSHEDWCGEHGVPESQCTRCDPSLIPAFKATGDWCVEHALPESQCLRCNPDLRIVRPPKKASP